MLFAVRLTHKRGRVLSHTSVLRLDPVVGELRVVFDPREEHPQRSRQANLHGEGVIAGQLGRYLLPTLHGPELQGMGWMQFSIAGFELIDGTAYRQAWLIEAARKAK